MTHPMIFWYATAAIALLFAAHEHGKTKTARCNFFTTAFAVAVQYTVLLWARGWNPL